MSSKPKHHSARDGKNSVAAGTESQYAAHVFMVRPAGFGFNDQTAQSNAFQVPHDSAGIAETARLALAEFDGLKKALEDAGVHVLCYQDDPAPHTPDSVFPNNWVSFHSSGRIVFYPMLANNRREEIRRDWIADMQLRLNVRWNREVDLTPLGEKSQFLEGTGSLVLDRHKQIAYASLSPRTHVEALRQYEERMECEVIPFEACDSQGQPIYHTNVVMSVGVNHAVVCTEAIPKGPARARLLSSLENSGKELIEIDARQMGEFAGNQLALSNNKGESLIVLSSRALASLTDEQACRLEAHGRLLAVPLDTIETRGGGSARCMLAEVHLPYV